MEWKKLLSDKRHGRTGGRRKGDLRTEFQRDYHRIIGSASFRRLQDKTQVFPLDRRDFVRTRLTHSLETASFARSLAQTAFTLIESTGADPTVNSTVRESAADILECAGLIHDIGNPPFGHFGEDVIRNWFAVNLPGITFEGHRAEELLTPQMRADLLHFEGNAQALRLLTKLHYLVDENGFHLTYALLDTIIKYPVSSDKADGSKGLLYKKAGYYTAEEDIFLDIKRTTGSTGCRSPLTFLLEAADDIAYTTADNEDGVKCGLITFEQLRRELRSDRYRPSPANPEYEELLEKLDIYYERACEMHSHPGLNTVQNWIIAVQGRLIDSVTHAFADNYTAIMEGTFDRPLTDVCSAAPVIKALYDIECRYIFASREIITPEAQTSEILNFLLDKFVFAALRHGTDKCTIADKKLYAMISESHREIYRIYSEGKDTSWQLYLRLLLVTDFICGMTDGYARELYHAIRG